MNWRCGKGGTLFNTIFGGVNGPFYFVVCLLIVCFTIFNIATVLAKAFKPKKFATKTDEEDEDEDTVIEVLGEIKSLLVKHNECLEKQTAVLEEIRDAVVQIDLDEDE